MVIEEDWINFGVINVDVVILEIDSFKFRKGYWVNRNLIAIEMS